MAEGNLWTDSCTTFNPCEKLYVCISLILEQGNKYDFVNNKVENATMIRYGHFVPVFAGLLLYFYA